MKPPGAVRRVLELLEGTPPQCGAVTVIAIDGPSGAGKTTLANAVAAELSAHRRSATVLSLDLLYPGWDGLAVAPGLVTEQVLEPLARGEQAAFDMWDWEHDRLGERRDVPATDVLVLEGCGALARPADAYAALRVWVEAPEAVRFARSMVRDGEAYAPHWERWAAQERELFARDRTRDRADLILQG